MTWSVYKRGDGSVHVIPDDDLRPHSLIGCCCRPKFEPPNMLIHRSFDGRFEKWKNEKGIREPLRE
jgi:hypothetical protein